MVTLLLVSTSDTIEINVFTYTTYGKNETGPKLSEGKQVSHAKFGVGIIKEKLGRDVFRVTFKDHITKKIHYDFLSLI